MILSVDCGSTNHKAALFDEELRRLSTRCKPARYSVDEQDRVELEPAAFWEDTVLLIQQACADARVRPRDIATISITSQAQTFTLLGPAGDPLIPFLSWADRRATTESKELAEQIGSVFHRHCSFPSPIAQLQLSKLSWISRRIPAQVRAIARIVSLPTFLALKLAGLHCIDTNLAAMGGTFSLLNNAWWDAGLSLCGFSQHACGQAVQMGTSVVAQASCPDLDLPADLRVVFAGNDQTAGAYANALSSDGVVLTLGTALVAYRFAGNAPGPFSEAGCWGPYPGSGYYELVTHAGSRSGRQETHPGARAVLEGICFESKQLLGRFPDQSSRAVTALGGGSTNDEWLQILAHVLNRPIHKGSGDALLGAAMLAAMDKSPAPAGIREFLPDASRASEYAERYKAWLSRKGQSVCA